MNIGHQLRREREEYRAGDQVFDHGQVTALPLSVK
jgi:hypothetical protein